MFCFDRSRHGTAWHSATVPPKRQKLLEKLYFRDKIDENEMPKRTVTFEEIVLASKLVRWWRKKRALLRWKRAGRKVRALNSITSSVDTMELRGRIGDAIIVTSDEAEKLQRAIERTTRQKLDFQIKAGDIVLGKFTELPEVGKPKMNHTESPARLGQPKRSRKNFSVGHAIVSPISNFSDSTLVQFYFCLILLLSISQFF